MFVQDLKLPGTNITAEISKEEANNFIQMCNVFASKKSHGPSIDDYLMKLSQICTKNSSTTCSLHGGVSSTKNGVNNINEASVNALQNLKIAVASMAVPNGSSSLEDPSRASSISITQPLPTQKLMNVIDIKKVSQTIPTIAVDLVNRMVQRCFNEMKIQALLTRYFKEFDSSFDVMPFGSATYGFGGSHTNFNILINAGS